LTRGALARSFGGISTAGYGYIGLSWVKEGQKEEKKPEAEHKYIETGICAGTVGTERQIRTNDVYRCLAAYSCCERADVKFWICPTTEDNFSKFSHHAGRLI
jgi:hypothetical protein